MPIGNDKNESQIGLEKWCGRITSFPYKRVNYLLLSRVQYLLSAVMQFSAVKNSITSSMLQNAGQRSKKRGHWLLTRDRKLTKANENGISLNAILS